MKRVFAIVMSLLIGLSMVLPCAMAEEETSADTIVLNVQEVSISPAEPGDETSETDAAPANDGDIGAIDPASDADPDDDGSADDAADADDAIPADDPVAQTLSQVGKEIPKYEGVYKAGDGTKPLATISAEELYEGLWNGDPFYVDLAIGAFGTTADEAEEALYEIIEAHLIEEEAYEAYKEAQREYEAAVARGDKTAVAPTPVIEPKDTYITVNGVEISLSRKLEALDSVIVDVNGDEVDGATRVDISIDVSAVYGVVYDGGEPVSITVPVVGQGTNFVVALDVSYSMNGNTMKAMVSAFRTLLGKILADERNSVSIVLFGDGAEKFYVNGNSGKTVFSAANGDTVNSIFSANMGKSSYTLNDLERTGYADYTDAAFGRLSGWTETGVATKLAYEVLTDLYDQAKNTGMILLTDGEANPRSQANVVVSEEAAIVNHLDAKIVNVTLGNDQNRFQSYLNPEYSGYTGNADAMKDSIIYRNIPNVSSQQLANEISTLFDEAFEIITNNGSADTLSRGILAAVEAQLIEQVPSTLQLVMTDDDTYEIVGKDAQGNTIIVWNDIGKANDGNLRSGDALTYSYFVVAGDAKTDIIGAYVNTEDDTVLVTSPVQKVLNDDEERRVAVVLARVETSDSKPSKATLPKTGVETIPTLALYMGLVLSAAGLVATKRYSK